VKVFWSWQSDRIPKNHHYFVRDALGDACKLIAKDAEVNESERPEVDHDTKDVAGTPDIVHSIAEKIQASAAFIADMTPVAVTNPASLRPDLSEADLPKSKYVQNANVMSELGFAENALGLGKIILVANTTHYPGPDALPFDWRNRRGPIKYQLADNATNADRKQERAVLAKALKGPLELILTANKQPTTEPEFHSPSELDDCLWKEANDGIRLRDRFEPGQWATYALPIGGRLAIQIMPTTWDPPSVTDLDNRIRGQDAPVLHIGGNSGNSGPNGQGVAAIWGLPDRARSGIQATTATQWFRDTGEIWAVDAGTFGENETERFFAIKYAIPRVANFLLKAIKALSEFSKGPFHVRIRAVGMDGTQWTLGSFSESYAALTDRAEFQATLRGDSQEERYPLLIGFWNEVRDAYGLPRAVDLDAFQKQAGLKLG
jgi:hypothetical protein